MRAVVRKRAEDDLRHTRHERATAGNQRENVIFVRRADDLLDAVGQHQRQHRAPEKRQREPEQTDAEIGLQRRRVRRRHGNRILHRRGR